MNKFFKAIALTACIMMSASCANDSILAESNNLEDEGTPITVTVEGASSRLVSEYTSGDDNANWKWWHSGDVLYVVNDNGQYLGQLSLVSGYGQNVAQFKGKLSTVRDGELLHIWYLGCDYKKENWYKNEEEGKTYDFIRTINVPGVKDILNGRVSVDFSKQCTTYPHLLEIMCQHANVTVADGVATLPSITMRHLTSYAPFELVVPQKDEQTNDARDTYWAPRAYEQLTVSGCYSRANIDLVNETITGTTKGKITYYNGGDTEFNIIHLTLVPGENAPKFEFRDPYDCFWEAELAGVTIEEGDYITSANHHFARVPSFRLPYDKQPYVIPTPISVQGSGHYVYFTKGNLYTDGVETAKANGTLPQYHIADKQYWEEDNDPLAGANTVFDDNHRYYLHNFLDTKPISSTFNQGVNPLFPGSLEQETWKSIGANNYCNYASSLNPGTIYKEQYNAAHEDQIYSNYSMVKPEGWDWLFNWCCKAFATIPSVPDKGMEETTGILLTGVSNDYTAGPALCCDLLGIDLTKYEDAFSISHQVYDQENAIPLTIEQINKAKFIFIPFLSEGYWQDGDYWTTKVGPSGKPQPIYFGDDGIGDHKFSNREIPATNVCMTRIVSVGALTKAEDE